MEFKQYQQGHSENYGEIGHLNTTGTNFVTAIKQKNTKLYANVMEYTSRHPSHMRTIIYVMEIVFVAMNTLPTYRSL